jgi:ribosomal protein S18 acetylase RimI-like enzyme
VILDKDRFVVVAELGGKEGSEVVGWVQTYHHEVLTDSAPKGHYLGGVTVDPAWRRRGIATALTDARIAWVGARADEVFYVVNIGNRASIDLHSRWGFREVERGPRFAGIEFSGGASLLMRAGLRRSR